MTKTQSKWIVDLNSWYKTRALPFGYGVYDIGIPPTSFVDCSKWYKKAKAWHNSLKSTGIITAELLLPPPPPPPKQ